MDDNAKIANALETVMSGEDLSHYAAKDAATVLTQNWRDAIADGQTLSSMLGDVDDVINILVAFKAALS
jgi:hypothetical protein